MLYGYEKAYYGKIPYGKYGKYPYYYPPYPPYPYPPYGKVPYGKAPYGKYGKYPYGASYGGGYSSVVPSTTVVTSPYPI